MRHALLLLAVLPLAPRGDAFEPVIRGLEFDVADLELSARFYAEAFGMRRDAARSSSRAAVLDCGGVEIVLRPVEASDAGVDTDRRGAVGWCLDLRVAALGPAVERARAAGARIDDPEPKRFPVGSSVEVRDPSGHAIHLLDADGDEPGPEPSVFDIGARVADPERGLQTFLDLGFEVATDAYRPVVPFEPAGAAAVVLHGGAREAAAAREARLLLAVPDLDLARRELSARGLSLGDVAFAAGPLGRSLAFRGPSGIAFRLVERSPAWLAFEQMKALAGEWEGESSAGWTSRMRYDVIAGGSAVLETTAFEAHPGDTMVTLAHMDGPELVLRHYCVAGNQPELVARASEDGGRTVTFEFRSASNLGARDVGHMDKVVFRFESEDAFSSAWTWYQSGEERWLEEIRYRRVRTEPAADGARADPACHPAR